MIKATARASIPLGFGCAPMMGAVGERAVITAVEIALDCGITHFDIARSYGYGEAEALLGRILRGRRDKVTITTKFGIQPSQAAGSLRMLKPMARRVAASFPVIARSLKRRSLTLLSGGQFSVQDAQRSLECSLRELRTDYVDYYLLHDGGLEDLQSERLLDFLDLCVEQGKIRSYGIAAQPFVVDDVLQYFTSRLSAIQFENNLFRPTCIKKILQQDFMVFTHSPFGGQDSADLMSRAVPRDRAAAGVWMEFLGLDRVDAGVIYGLMLCYALKNLPSGIVICSMYDPAHIRANVEVAKSHPYKDWQVERFVELMKNVGPR